MFSSEQGDGEGNVEESEDDQAEVGSGGGEDRDQCIDYGSDGGIQQVWVKISRWEHMEWALLL